jgi:hypothetical protein
MSAIRFRVRRFHLQPWNVDNFEITRARGSTLLVNGTKCVGHRSSALIYVLSPIRIEIRSYFLTNVGRSFGSLRRIERRVERPVSATTRQTLRPIHCCIRDNARRRDEMLSDSN